MLTKEDKTLIKMSGNKKKYGVKRLLRNCQTINGASVVLRTFSLRTTGSIERAPGSGRLRTTRTAENVDAVGDLVESQENQPQTHRSTRQISRELGIPQTNNWR